MKYFKTQTDSAQMHIWVYMYLQTKIKYHISQVLLTLSVLAHQAVYKLSRV